MVQRKPLTLTSGIPQQLQSGDVVSLGYPYAVCQGRLTLASTDPVPTTDQTAKTTLYFTPYDGNVVSLWNGTEWQAYTFTERSLSLSGLAANTNFDIFLYDNAGTLTLQSVAWTNNTTRASAISRRDGVWVKTSDDRILLGTIRTTSTIGQCEDSELRRYVSNIYNLQPRTLQKEETTSSWTHASTVWRQARATATNQVEILCSQPTLIRVNHSGYSSENGAIAIGLDSTSAVAAKSTLAIHGATGIVSKQATLDTVLSIGYHTITMLEYSASGTVTFYGLTVGGSPSICKLAGYILN